VTADQVLTCLARIPTLRVPRSRSPVIDRDDFRQAAAVALLDCGLNDALSTNDPGAS
jgi:hypothetical protein